MTGNPEDLSSAREIALPEIWSFQNADRVLRWCHLAKAATVSNCTLRKAEPDCGKMPKWRVMLPDGEVLLVRKGHPLRPTQRSRICCWPAQWKCTGIGLFRTENPLG